MKKILLTIALTAVCAGAFAQGKINVLNDANHAVYFGSNLYPGDAGLAGTLVGTAATPGGSIFTTFLYGYAGTGAGSLTLLTSVPMLAGSPGIFGPSVNFAPTGIPGGSPSTFQVRVSDQLGRYYGESQIFQLTPGASIQYVSLVSASSTWAIGTQAVPGGFGAIAVNVIPEPTSMVLAGLGAASLLLFRRRS